MRIKHNMVYIYGAIVLISLYLVLAILFHPLQQDEGVFLTIAQGLKKGLLPYRDFFDHKPPAIYFLFGLIAIFSKKVLLYKLLLIANHLASSIVIFLISKKFKIASHYSIFFYLAIALIFEGEKMIAESFGALFLLLALYAYISTKKSFGYFLAGFLIGIAILFKQTFIISAFAFLIFFIWQKTYRKMLMFCAGSLLPIAVIMVWLHLLGLIPAAYQQIILYNLSHYPAENIFNAIGSLTPSFIYTLPIWVLFVYETFMLFKSRYNANHNLTRDFVIIFLLATLPILSFFSRHYPHYWLQISPFVAILGADTLKCVLCHNRNSNSNPPKHAQAWPSNKIGLVVTSFLLISASFFIYSYLQKNLPKYQAEQKLAHFIRQQNRPIYAENQFIGMYFLTDRKPPNKYLYITEITDWSEQAEEKTIKTLKNDDYLIIWPADSNYPYAKTLQRYIFENYKPIFWQHDLGAAIYEKR